MDLGYDEPVNPSRIDLLKRTFPNFFSSSTFFLVALQVQEIMPFFARRRRI